MDRLLVALSVLSWSGGCGASAPAARAPTEEPDPCGASLAELHAPVSPGWAELPEEPVAAVRVGGARTVPQRLVRDAIELPLGQPVDPATVREDVRRILGLKVFEDVRVHADSSPEGLTVTYEVVERPLVREVYVAGVAEGVRSRRLEAVAGEVFVPGRLHRLTRKLEAEHHREGYADAKARVTGRRAGSRSVDVCFAVDAGRRWLIASFELTGNERLGEIGRAHV